MPVFKSMHVGCRSSADRTDRAGEVRLWFTVWHFGLAMLARLCVRLGIGLGIGLASVTAASAQNAVTGMRVGMVTIDEAPGLRLVVETVSPLQAQLSLLRDPYRLIIDMADTSWQVTTLPRRGDLSVGPASAYRFGVPQPDTGRLVIELAQPAAPVRAFVLPPASGGQRFVVDLVDVGDTAFMVAAAALKKNPVFSFAQIPADAKTASSATTAITRQMKLPKSKSALLKQAICRRRQGGDCPSKQSQRARTGAGLCLSMPAMAARIRGRLAKPARWRKKSPWARRVIWPKNCRQRERSDLFWRAGDDRYLRLRERIRLARRQQADVFISLHADAAHSSKARGISVFTLSDTASDKEAAALARKENKADLIGGPDLGVEDPDAAGELLRMFQRESMNQSSQLAAAILAQIRDMPGGDRRGHRFAGFAVLKAPDMPSVLVEMGFLSNREDEKNLRNPAYIRQAEPAADHGDYKLSHGLWPKIITRTRLKQTEANWGGTKFAGWLPHIRQNCRLDRYDV
jgi:N-acetylmuramoyl-L-alanine amidase